MVIFMNKYQENFCETKKNTKENGDKMPTVEKVNYEMTDYLHDIEVYMEHYKSLSQKEVRKQAKKNLMATGIIDEHGNLTGFYKNT